MGLFDFAGHVGRKLFGDDDSDKAEAIKKHIEEDNPGISNLGVAFDDGTVTLAGIAQGQAAMEKAVLMAGNVKGVEKVVADEIVVLPPEVTVAVNEGAEAAGEPQAGHATPEPQGAAAASATVIEAQSDTTYYEIQKGDTLSAIAKRFYGSANKYPKIFEANREVIKDPDLIYPGQKIRIPKED